MLSTLKKVLITCALALWGAAAFAGTAAAETVTIPDYPCIIKNQDVYYQDSLYPLLSYRDVTYFPMTWGYCKALNLSSAWVEGEGLYIAYFPSSGEEELPVYETRSNAKTQTATIPTYPIYINGKAMDNRTAQYPLLNFRGVTYFPMTWDYAQGEFNWTADWDGSRFLLNPWQEKYEETNYWLKEVRSDCAVLGRGRTLTRTEQNEDGETVYYPMPSFDVVLLDYSTGAIVYFYEANQPAQAADVPLAENPKDTQLINGKIVWQGQELAEVQALKNGSPQEKCQVFPVEKLLGGKALNLGVYTDVEIPAPYTPDERYAFVRQGGKFIRIAPEKTNAYITEAAEGTDGSIYVNVVYFTGWKGFTHPQVDLFRVQPEGTVERLNDRFPDFGRMTIIGMAANKLYLKCEWCGETNPEQITGSSYSISPYNDGYYTWDGKNLAKIAPYVYTDEDFVSPAVQVYGIVNWKETVQKMN